MDKFVNKKRTWGRGREGRGKLVLPHFDESHAPADMYVRRVRDPRNLHGAQV